MHCYLLYAYFSNETGKPEQVVLDEVAAACSDDPDLVALGLEDAHSHCLQFRLTDTNLQFLQSDRYIYRTTGENWALPGGGAVIKTCANTFEWRNHRRPKTPLTFKGKYGITLEQMERFVRVCERVGLLLLATKYFRLDTMRLCEGKKLYVTYRTALRRGVV